jgi:molybdate transport system substrate-binding protein
LLVSAASSLTDAMNDLAKAFSVKYPSVQVRFNFAASGVLAQQIEQGAPVDVFASAGEKEMDEVSASGKLVTGTRKNFVTNRLALIAPIASTLRNWKGLASPLIRRIALPIPEQVPSGRYGKQTLEHRHLWASVQSKLVFAHNVRQALAYVAGGDVDAGIVFATDAEIERSRVKIVALAKPHLDHAPIVYPVALIAGDSNLSAARLFETFLLSPEGRRIFVARGFSSP